MSEGKHTLQEQIRKDITAIKNIYALSAPYGEATDRLILRLAETFKNSHDQLVKALKYCLTDLKWAEAQDPRTCFQSSIIKGDEALKAAGEEI